MLDGEFSDKKARLGFITPMGKVYITDEIMLSDGKGEYKLPFMLLDGKGILTAQLLIYGEEDFLIKSPPEEYTVAQGIDGENPPDATKSSLKSLAFIFSEIENKSDQGHIHDGRYFTREENTSLISSAIENHSHDERYYTESEIDEKINLIFENGPELSELHNHDDRYYTSEETDVLLKDEREELMSALEGHNHDDRYYTSEETDVLLEDEREELMSALEGHNHDGIYATVESLSEVLEKEASNENAINAINEETEGISARLSAEADFVTERGTSGSWNYIKWASGIVECFGLITLTVKSVASVSDSSNLSVVTSVELPKPTFARNTTTCAQVTPSSWKYVGAHITDYGTYFGVSLCGRTSYLSAVTVGSTVDAHIHFIGIPK